jgi:hypothetical protein
MTHLTNRFTLRPSCRFRYCVYMCHSNLKWEALAFANDIESFRYTLLLAPLGFSKRASAGTD